MVRIMAGDALTAFSPSNDILAIATSDGRIKTWDVGSGHLRGELVHIAASTSGSAASVGQAAGHLAIDYSCIAWVPLSSAAKKAKKRGSKVGVQLVLVLGTGAGDVVAWDTVLAQLKWRMNDCNPGGVKAVAFSKSGQCVYAAGADGMICELSGETGELLGKFKGAKHPVSSLAVSPDGNSLLMASSELKLFDLSTKKRIKTFAGHPSAVSAMAFSQDGKHAFSCATGERQVVVWKVGASKGDRGAACTLSLDNPAIALHCGSSDREEGDLKVLAVSETGVAYIWLASSIEELVMAKPEKISVGTGNSAKIGKGVKPSILAACLEIVSGENPQIVLVAHGTTGKPKFERVTVGTPGTKHVLGVDAGGALLPATQVYDAAREDKQDDITVLGPDNAADAVSRPHLESGNVTVSSKKSKKKRQASADLDSEPHPVNSLQVPGGHSAAMEEDHDDELTMEERLLALGIVEKSPSNGENAEPLKPPKADSVAVLLSQALQGDYPALLEQCLAVSNEKVIVNTVRALRPPEAGKFLSACIVKLETQPRRGLALVPWVRAVLLQHAASLMSNSAMQPVLSTLYQLIEARLSVFQPLLALSGRLDLIAAQILFNETKVSDEMEAAIVYEEQDSEPEGEEAEDGDSSEELVSDQSSESEDDVLGSDEEMKAGLGDNGHQFDADITDDSD